MNIFGRGVGRTIWVAIRTMLMFTLLLGVVYPLVIWGFAQLMPGRANGSLVTNEKGQVVGSVLIGQSFTDAQGNPLPKYFQSRPSAAGKGYDGASSSGSNLGPENPELVEAIKKRKVAIAAFNGVDESQVPPDAVTTSASGLDPDISPEYAAIQINRVAKARNLPVDVVKALVAKHTNGRQLGYLGEPTVNVLKLNIALDKLGG